MPSPPTVSTTIRSFFVGYTITDFVVSGGEICAALIKEKLKADNIRVLVNTTGYKSRYHEEVRLTADRDFTVKRGEELSLQSLGAVGGRHLARDHRVEIFLHRQLVHNQQSLLAKKERRDLSAEADFREFILSSEEKTFDQEFSWYRWEVNFPSGSYRFRARNRRRSASSR